MVKRKRTNAAGGTAPEAASASKKAKASTPFTIQIVTGSYDRVLHGVTASVGGDDKVEFADTFLFNAHTSAIRCLALSPPSDPVAGKTQKVMLATGSTDERINVYNISAHPPRSIEDDQLSKVAPRKILEDPSNREMGSLLHHSSTITKLAFPTKSKLVSASEDSTIAITRIRDMSMLSSIKVPIPKPMGRPSGDTAALGSTPAGVNDFAVHPSMKVMISVSKGERCMRLWNLLTAKKAGVLNFGREVLQEMGEGRYTSGEGRSIEWDTAGEEFCVGFDRDLLVFGTDGQPKCKVMPEPKRKIHKFCYVTLEDAETQLLAVATEDGRIMLFSTQDADLHTKEATANAKTTPLSTAKLVAQLGGPEAGISGRIKDFSFLRPVQRCEELFVACGGSDGLLRIIRVEAQELERARKGDKAAQVGQVLGTYKTDNRITCLEAFVMIPRPEGAEDSEVEEDESSGDDGSEDEGDDQ